MVKAVIFDFDGTIADSFELFVKSLHKLLGKSETLSAKTIEELRGKQIKEITALLGITPLQLPRFVIKGRKEIGDNFGEVRAFDFIPELIKELSSRGYNLYILSTNNAAVIAKFLEENGLDSYFTDIYADISLIGKARSLKRLMKKHDYSKIETIYIGDEVRDIEATCEAGVACISVSWGYSTLESLKAHNPDHLVSNPQDILDILK